MAINENGISDCGTSVCRSKPAALSAEMLGEDDRRRLIVLKAGAKKAMFEWDRIAKTATDSAYAYSHEKAVANTRAAIAWAERLLGSADGK